MIEPSNVYIKKVKKLEGAQDCFLVEPLQFFLLLDRHI